MKKELYIIKIGGNVIDDEALLHRFLKDISEIDAQKIIVHGGGKLATKLSQQLGIETRMVDGRRITDEETLKVVTMTYAGWINKHMAAKLNALGVKAMGISGADLFLIPAVKRKSSGVDFGFVGDLSPESIHVNHLDLFIQEGITLIVAPITADIHGQLLNTNADSIAAGLGISLSRDYDVKLLYCFDQKGVMNEDWVLPTIDQEKFEHLKNEKIIINGMIPKLENAFAAIEKGVTEVVLGHASQIKQMIKKHAGTRIIK